MLATIEDKTVTGILHARYGVMDDTEFQVRTSYAKRDTDVLVASRKIGTTGRSEIGNVELNIGRTVLHEKPGRLDIVLGLTGIVPTGGSSYAIGGGFALVKSVKPVVLFAGARYLHTFSRTFQDQTRLEPKHRVDAALGYAYALNKKLTLSSVVSGVFTQADTFGAVELRQQDNFNLTLGLTSKIAPGFYIEPTIGFGLDDPGDRFVIGVSMHYTFKP